jgi:hypothetical protein
MKGFNTFPLHTAARYLSVSVLAASTVFAYGQNVNSPAPAPTPSVNSAPSTAPTGGWQRVGDSDAAPAQNSQNADPSQAPPPPLQQPQPYPSYNGQQPSYGQQPGYGQQPAYGQQPNYSQQQPYQPAPVPASLTVPAGTFLTVRVNQLLSSDKNQTGDAFSATLTQPVVVNGVVVAEPGQTIAGRVTESVKAGHIEGVARLGIQLTTLTLVDGQQLPIQSTLISRKGPTSVGQDAGVIAGATGFGAVVGAAADWGRGAAIGAGAGAAAGIIGVLVTRGHPSVIYPEQMLTFRIETPLSVSTVNAPQAFRYVQPNEYDRPYDAQPGPYASMGSYPAPAYPPAYYTGYGYGYPYPYYGYGYGFGYPYYWGPSFFIGGGYWGRGYYGRGYVGGGVRGGARR